MPGTEFKGKDSATDWDRYYQSPYKGAAFTRRLMGRLLTRLMRDYLSDAEPGSLTIAELGGANSSFFPAIDHALRPAEYHIFDNNRVGLELTMERFRGERRLSCHLQDIMDLEWGTQFDLVFSVGLIEHFPPQDTQQAIESHFRLVKPSGIVILTFPTPTFLYRMSRAVSEFLGLWIFHDERPLRREEVEQTTMRRVPTLYSTVVWPIIFTQRVMVIGKGGKS